MVAVEPSLSFVKRGSRLVGSAMRFGVSGQLLSQLRNENHPSPLACETTSEPVDAHSAPSTTELPTAATGFADLILVGLIVGAMVLGFIAS